MDDKEKSVIDKVVDAVTSSVGEVVKAAVPTPKQDKEELAEPPTEQMLVGDAAIAPEAIPAPIAPMKTVRNKRTVPKKTNKRAAAAKAKSTKSPAKKSAAKNSVPKKMAKKSAPKKVARRAMKSVKKAARKKKQSKK
jgi:hypothetical protein